MATFNTTKKVIVKVYDGVKFLLSSKLVEKQAIFISGFYVEEINKEDCAEEGITEIDPNNEYLIMFTANGERLVYCNSKTELFS